MRNRSLLGVLFFFGAGLALWPGCVWGEAAAIGRSTRVTVDSSELEPFSTAEREESQEPLIFYQDQNGAVGINKDGDPSYLVQF